jgi:energy-coupling factor transport system permease protein
VPLPNCRGELSIEQRRDGRGLTMAQRFDLYQRGDSYLYHLDPRTKVIAVLAVFVISVLFTNPLFLAPVFFTVIIALIVGRVSYQRVAILLKSLAVLVIISLLLWPVIYEHGKLIGTVGPFRVTQGGVLYGVGMSFRILDMVIVPIALFLTTPQPDFVAALRRLGLPYKATFALSTSLRFLPTIVGIGESIVEAQRARGLDPNSGGPIRRLRSYARILGPLVITSIRIAQQLSLAVEARAFSINRQRTYLRVLRFGRMDRVVLGGIALLMVTSIVLRVVGLGVLA